MKNFILLLVFICHCLCFAQDTEFKFTKDGLTDFVVIPVADKTQNEIYKKTLDWVAMNFKEPGEVIKATIENEYIRIEGFSKELICYSYMGKRCGDTKYEIEISFKDGKYKFDVLSISEYNNQSKSILWTNFDIVNTAAYFDKKGEAKSSYKFIVTTVPEHFNNLNLNLKNFLVSDGVSSKKNDW
jgi:hypothetical protein